MTTETGSNSSLPKEIGVAVVTSENPVCNALFPAGHAAWQSVIYHDGGAKIFIYRQHLVDIFGAANLRTASNEPASSMASSAREIFCLRAINDGSKIISILSS